MVHGRAEVGRRSLSMRHALHLAIRPLDTWMFRDGRPFSQDDPGAAAAESVFPPHPPTMTGLVRALAARRLGWSGSGSWPDNVRKVLGDGVDWHAKDKAWPFRLLGPTVWHGNEPWYPAPLHLVAPKDGLARLAASRLTAGRSDSGRLDLLRLVPGVEPLSSDLGGGVRAALPAPERSGVEGLDGLSGWWISRAGLEAVLAGRLPAPAQLRHECELWLREDRVGIGINGGTNSRLAERRVIDGALYTARHVRPRVGTELRVTFESDALISIATRQIIPFGGEHRMAEAEPIKSGVSPPKVRLPRAASTGIGVLVYHATPCILGPLPGPGASLAGIATIVSACLGKPVPIGGWDGANEKREPIPMHAAVPAGSVWFLSATAEEAKALADEQPRAIGHATAWGFGHIFLGTWSLPITKGQGATT